MKNESEDKIAKVELVDIDRLVPNEWNPNYQEPETFNMLTEEIRQDGFDEPIIVVPSGDGKFRIISGEHRWRAAKVLNYKQVPIVVREGWDEKQQMVKTVRRNLIRGKLDEAKFQKVVDAVFSDSDKKKQAAEIARQFGFESEADFLKHYKAESRRNENLVAEQLIDGTRKELKMLDNLSVLLNEQFQKFGDSVPQSYMYFMYGGKTHLCVDLTSKLRQIVDQITKYCSDSKTDINEVLAKGLQYFLDQARFKERSKVRKLEELEEDDLEFEPDRTDDEE